MIEENEVMQNVEVSSPPDSAGDNLSNAPDSVLDNPETVETGDSAPDQEAAPDAPAAETEVSEELSERVEAEDFSAEEDEEYYNFAEMAEEQAIEDARLFFETPFESYTVTEGLLLLIFVVLFLKTMLGLARG